MDRLRVHLRPFEEPDLVMIDRFVSDEAFSGSFEWTGFGWPREHRRRWERDRLLGSSPYCLVVASEEDGSAIGWMDWRQNERPGPGVWEIGAFVVPEMRGRGAGTAAHDLLVEYLFANTPANRIWAGTEVDNIAEQRALEHCGFHQDGCLRGIHFRDGQWRDGFVYGLTRDDNHTRPRPRREPSPRQM